MQKEGKFVNTNNRVEDEFENTDLITEMNINYNGNHEFPQSNIDDYRTIF